MRTPGRNDMSNPDAYNANSGQGGGRGQVGGYGTGAAQQPQSQQYAPGYQGQGYQPQGQPMPGQYGQQPYQPQQYGMPQGQPVAAGQYPGQFYAYGQQYVAPATSQPQQLKQRKSRKRFWIAIIVAILCIALAVVLWFTIGDGGKSSRQGSLGQLEGKTPEEIQAELDRVVDDGMFNISIASIVEVPDGTSPAELRIENVPGNQYLMRVTITRDDTGEQIYETDLIEPNYHIQSDTLDVDLPAGLYDCTATFEAYDNETEDLIGTAGAKIQVDVKS